MVHPVLLAPLHVRADRRYTSSMFELLRRCAAISLLLAPLALPWHELAAQDTTPPRRRSATDSAVRDSARAGRRKARSASDSEVGAARLRERRGAGEGSDSVPAWPVATAEPLPGSILPTHRIVAFYGNPRSKRMGVLGALPVDSMLTRLDQEVTRWTAADSATPVQPALHLIAVVAQGTPGRDGKFRQRMDSALIERVYGWAQQHHALLFLDVQLGRSSLKEELPRLVPFLRRPDVHLGLDPEFAMPAGGVPGTAIGALDAGDVNEAIGVLAGLVSADQLPPKVLIVHRFTRDMLTRSRAIRLDPRVQVVINMDGWGPPWMKRESYRRYVYRYPVQFTGFKLFYHNDTKAGDPLMTPADVLALFPRPLYIQYQ